MPPTGRGYRTWLLLPITWHKALKRTWSLSAERDEHFVAVLIPRNWHRAILQANGSLRGNTVLRRWHVSMPSLSALFMVTAWAVVCKLHSPVTCALPPVMRYSAFLQSERDWLPPLVQSALPASLVLALPNNFACWGAVLLLKRDWHSD